MKKLLWYGLVAIFLSTNLYADSKRVNRIALTLSNEYSGSISLPGQEDRFTFTGTPGQRIFYDNLNTTNQSLLVRLIAPSGTQVWGDYNSVSETAPFYLLEAGTYTFVVDGYVDSTGDYRFRLVDAGIATLITANPTNSVVLNPSSKTQAYRFNGTAGQKIALTTISASTNNVNWALVNPANGTVAGYTSIENDLGTNVLTATGSYLVIVAGQDGAGPTVNFQFRLTDVSDAPVTPSGFGTVNSGTVAANETNTFNYVASAGTIAFYDSLIANYSSDARVQLLDPDGNAIFDGGSYSASFDLGPYFLPRSGTYKLNIISGSSGGTFSFRLLNVSVAPVLAFGNTNAATFSPLFRTDVYRFEGSPGQRLFYDGMDSDSETVYTWLYNSAFGNVYIGSNNSDSDVGPFTLTGPGTYYLVVESRVNDANADYSFRLLDLAQSPVSSLSFNTTITSTLDPGQKAVLYRFDGVAGQRFFFDGLGANSAANWYLYDPLDVTLNSGNVVNDFVHVLPRTGVYALLVTGGQTVAPIDYSIRVVTAATTNFSLTLGAVMSGAITSVGQEHRYTFNGTAGQRLFYDALQNDNENILVRFFDPRGTLVWLNANSDSENWPQTLTDSGTYTVVLGGQSDVLGTYSFRLIDIGQLPSANLALNTVVTGTNENGLTASVFRFTGTQGQRLFFDSLLAGSGSWTFYGADNYPYYGTASANNFEYTVPKTGTNVLIIQSGSTNGLGYSFRVVTPATVPSALTLNTVVSNVLAGAGDDHSYTFTATNGQRIYYDGYSLPGSGLVSASILNPNGTSLWSDSSGNNMGVFTLTTPGTYTIVQHNGSDGPVAYQFRLLNLANQPALSFGTTTNQLAPGTQSHLYRFDGTAGQRIDLQSVSAPADFQSDWRLIDVYNTTLVNPYLHNDIGPVTLPVTGTYALIVEGNDGISETVDYEILMIDADPITAPSGLVAWWPGDGSAIDIIGGNNGTLQGNTSYSTGKVAQSFSFDGTSYVEVPDSPQWAFGTGNFTINLWAKFDDTNGYQAFMASDNGPGLVDKWIFWLHNAKLEMTLYGSQGLADIGVPFIPETNQWYHLVITRNGEQYSFYTNGVLAGVVDDSRTIPDATQPLTIGNAEGQFFFSGQLDEMQVHNRALSAGEIQAIFSAGSVGMKSPSAGFGTFSGTLVANSTNVISIAAPAGTPIYIDDLTNNNSVNLFLFDKYGQSVFSYSGGNGSVDPGFVILASGGTYTLQVVNPGGSDADYDFRLLNLATDTIPLTPGTTYEQPSLTPRITEFYRFEGTVGQRLFYDGLEGDNQAVYPMLLQPNGTQIFGYNQWYYYYGPNADADAGPITLPVSGTYYLAMMSVLPDENHYKFRLLDLNQAPSLATTIGATNGIGLVPVPASSLVVTGSYVDMSLSAVDELDWRSTQTIAGTRSDATINFTNRDFGNRAGVGITGGTDEDWDNFSVQWDGTVTVVSPNTRLFLSSDNGSRMWIDANNDTVFDVTELVNNGWGVGSSGTIVSSLLLPTGTYRIRIQYEETTSDNYAVLSWDNGFSVGPYAAQPFRFVSNAGRLFFDGLQPSGIYNWYHYAPNSDSAVASGGALNDFESTSPSAGTNFVILYNPYSTNAQPYKFRILAPPALTNGIAIGNIYSNTLTAGQEHYYTFTGTAGQRLYFDDLAPFDYSTEVRLTAPSGTVVFQDYYLRDNVPFLLTETGTYTLFFHNRQEANFNYSFRVLDISLQPVLSLDATNNLSIALGTTASLFQINNPAQQRLFFDALSNPITGGWTLYGPTYNTAVGNNLGYDFELASPAQANSYVLVLNTEATNNYDYSFRVVPGNHAPVLATIGNRTANEEQLLNFQVFASDLESDNDRLTFSLDAGAPSGLSLNPTTGVISWSTPTEAQGPGVYPVTVRVTDDGIPSMNTSETFNITVNEFNKPPVLTVPGNQTIDELTALSVSASATDADIPANTLTFGLVNPPTGMTINTSSGLISWTPDESQGPNTNTIFVKVTDNNPAAINTQQLSMTNTFQVIVREINVAPVLSVPSTQTINELTALNVNATATDSDNPANVLTFAKVSGPAGLTVAANGNITWTPAENDGPSTNTVVVKVTDNNPQAFNTQQLSVTNSFTVIVNEVNSAPTLTVSTNQVIAELTTLTVTNTATDSDNTPNTLTFALAVPLTGVSINATNGVLTWTPDETQGPSTNIIFVKVTDNNTAALSNQQLSTTNSFQVIVQEINVAPVLTVPTTQTIAETGSLNVNATATDADVPVNSLTFAKVSGPGALSVAANGNITWTLTESDGPGSYTVFVKVTDNNPQAVNTTQLSVTNSFTVNVNEVNVAPVLTVPANQTIAELAPFSANATATDSDLPANTLTFAKVSGPSGLNVAANGAISWTPSEADGPNPFTVSVKVTDNGSPALSTTNSFTLTVSEVNSVPSLTVATNQTINELTTLSVTNTAGDSDLPSNTLTFAIVSGPTNAAINVTNGVLTWTPNEGQGPSTNTILVSVTDNGSPTLSATNSFVVTVNEVNAAPALTLPSNQTIPELVAFNANANATDSDVPVNSLTFALVSGPSGLNVAANGAITWTPDESQGPLPHTVTVKVTDNGSPALSTTNSFTLTVSEVNAAPVLAAISNRTINPGQILTVTNTATDSDIPANSLNYTLVNPVSGVSLNSSSGVLTWRPTVAQANSTNTISVRVTDNGSPALNDTKSFTVVVNPLAPVTLTPLSYNAGQFQMQINGTVGPDYILQRSSTLTNWTSIITNTPSSLPFNYTDTSGGTSNRFYRVLLAP